MKVEFLMNPSIECRRGIYGTCRVTREPGDKKIPTETGWDKNGSDPNSTFFYRIKHELIKQGHDVIKKRMWKDGHLVDDYRQYIRTRGLKKGSFCIYDEGCAIRSAVYYYNEIGKVDLQMMFDLLEPYKGERA